MKKTHKLALSRETLRSLDSVLFDTVLIETISHGDCSGHSPRCG